MYQDDCLFHHGIKGQRWGVRRYQNVDGTLTNLGKARYKGNVFKAAEEEVRSFCSNVVKPFKKSQTDISDVIARSGLNESRAAVALVLANKMFDDARKREPQITKDVISCVSKTGSKMYGLQYRLKQPGSLAGKIGSDAINDGVSLKEASRNVKDTIRYTTVFDTNDFVKNYYDTKRNLEQKGYTELSCKNYFEKYKRGEVMHKSVQSTYMDPSGYRFELQYQTYQSQAAKELKIPIYEERRSANVTHRRALELEAQMRDLADNVQDPPRINRIKSK